MVEMGLVGVEFLGLWGAETAFEGGLGAESSVRTFLRWRRRFWRLSTP